jgi:MFS family permease
MSAVTETAQDTRLPRAFHYLWSASLIATLGDGALLAAIPLLAKSLTTDPQLVAGAATAATAPWLLLSLVGGAVVDRYDRRRLMTLAQVCQVLLVGAVATVAAFGLTRLWMLYVLAFGLGAADVLFTSASQAFVPSLVGRDRLEKANGRIITAQQVSQQFAGPPLGAALFAFAVPLPFWLNTVTFTVSVLLIMRIRPVGRPPRTGAPRSIGSEIGEGLRWLARNRLPRVLTLGAGAANFRVIALLGARQVAIGAQVICPLTWIAIGTIGRDPVTVVALFAVFSICISLWSVVALSARQRLIPDELLGRVTSASRMLSYGAIPLGSLAGGYIATRFGLIAPWLVGGVLSLCVTLLALPAMLRWEGTNAE